MAKGIRTWLCLAAVCLLAACWRLQAEETGGAGMAAAERTESAYMEIHAGNEAFRVTLEDNDSARALVRLIGKGERSFPASDYGGFEKIVDLGKSLPRDDEQITSRPGDVLLYAGSRLVIFYGHNSWAYTRIGHIENADAGKLRSALLAAGGEITLSTR